MSSFVKHKWHYLEASKLMVLNVSDFADCAMECLKLFPTCLSLNMASSPDEEKIFWCELLLGDVYNNSVNLRENALSHHYSKLVSPLQTENGRNRREDWNQILFKLSQCFLSLFIRPNFPKSSKRSRTNGREIAGNISQESDFFRENHSRKLMPMKQPLERKILQRIFIWKIELFWWVSVLSQISDKPN